MLLVASRRFVVRPALVWAGSTLIGVLLVLQMIAGQMRYMVSTHTHLACADMRSNGVHGERNG